MHNGNNDETRPPSYYFGVGPDQKLDYHLKWPYWSECDCSDVESRVRMLRDEGRRRRHRRDSAHVGGVIGLKRDL